MMLESTYVAVHSSFRALLGVAQHFSRLRYVEVHMSLLYCIHAYTYTYIHMVYANSMLANNETEQVFIKK